VSVKPSVVPAVKRLVINIWNSCRRHECLCWECNRPIPKWRDWEEYSINREWWNENDSILSIKAK